MSRQLLPSSWLLRIALTAWTAAAVALAGGCAGLGGGKHSKKDLSTAVEAFNTALRWGDFKSAAGFVAAEELENFWRRMDSIERRVRLTDYEVRNIAWNDRGQPISVYIRYRYFFMNNPELRAKTIHQHWVYDQRVQAWQIAAAGLEPLLDP